METYTINLYPIFKMICILFAIVGVCNVSNNLIHIVGRYGKDKLDNKKDLHAKGCDADIIQDLVQKFPLVSKDFMVTTEKQQNIENNQEIQEINKRLDRIDYWLNRIIIQQNITIDEVKNKNNEL